MRIEVVKWIFDDSKSYKIKSISKCCDDIIESEVVVLTEDYESGDDTDYGVKLSNLITYYDGEDFDESTTYESIKFCPFCGEKIEINIVETIDKNEEYNQLENQIEELSKKERKTDSIKKSNLLREEIRELRDKINLMYQNDEFKKEINNEF